MLNDHNGHLVNYYSYGWLAGVNFRDLWESRYSLGTTLREWYRSPGWTPELYVIKQAGVLEGSGYFRERGIQRRQVSVAGISSIRAV